MRLATKTSPNVRRRRWPPGWPRSAVSKDCRGTGTAGRIGIFELLMVDEDLQDRIAGGATTSELRSFLRQQGQATLLDDGLDKVREGRISVDELIRIIPYRQILAASRTAQV